jgi:two-component system response regulator PhoP
LRFFPKDAVEKPPAVAVIEDEPIQRQLCVRSLRAQGFVTWEAACAEEFFKKALVQTFDIVVVDLMLPGDSGISVIRELTRLEQVGIIAMTGSSSEDLKISAWNSGIDNLLRKPLLPNELNAAVYGLWKRISSSRTDSTPDTGQPWLLLESEACLITPTEERIALTKGEAYFVRILSERPQEVISNELLADKVFSGQSEACHRLNMLVSRLNKKFKAQKIASPIRSIFGKGRVFAAELKRSQSAGETYGRATPTTYQLKRSSSDSI